MMAFPQSILSTMLIVLVLTVAKSSAGCCVSGTIDAITRLSSDGDTYVFDGDYVAKLDGDDIASGYPKLISDVFSGLPGHIDAAIRWPNGKVYFFKGNEYYRYSGTSQDSGYPISIATGWPGLPDDLDAAVLWPGDQKAYFFRGSRYWRYDVSVDSTDSGYPLSIDGHWGDYVHSTDAAFIYSNGYCYLFHGEQYWRYDTDEDDIDTTYTYPKATTKEWFGCPSINADVDMAGDNLFN